MSNPFAPCTLQEYRKSYARPEHYKSLKTNCIIGYVLCGLNLVLALLLNIAGLIDVVVQLVCLLGVHMGRIKGFAVALIVYSIVGMVLALVSGSTPGGWLWIIIGSSMLKVFKKIDQDYRVTMCP